MKRNILSAAEKSRVLTTLSHQFCEHYTVAPEDMHLIFSMPEDRTFEQAIKEHTISANVNDTSWHETSLDLARLMAAMAGAFGTKKEGVEAAKVWLRAKNEVDLDNQTPLELLCTGRPEARKEVLQAALFTIIITIDD